MKYPVLVLLILYVFCGCASVKDNNQGDVTAIDSRDIASELLLDTFTVYQNYNRAEFSKIVSEKFSPSKTDFINSVENSFYATKIIEINYFLDKVFTERDKIVVSFKWEKKTVPYVTGVITLSTGKTQFVFSKEAGKWLLYQLKDDNPF